MNESHHSISVELDFKFRTRSASLPAYIRKRLSLKGGELIDKIRSACLRPGFHIKNTSIPQKNTGKFRRQKSFSPHNSEVTPITSRKEMEESRYTNNSSFSHLKKNFPSLCHPSLKEIMQKRRENFFHKNEPDPTLKDLDISPLKLMNSIKKSSKKSIQFPLILEVNRKMENESLLMFEKAIAQHFLFRNFTQIYKEKLYESLKCYEISPNALIFREDTFADSIYFIEKGLIGVFKQDNLIRPLKPGNFLGEQQILSLNPLNCSYKALEKSLMWGIKSEVIAKLMLEMNEKKYEENRKFLTPIHYFQSLDNQQIDEICYNMSIIRFGKGTVIVKEGETYLNFYIIKEGVILANENKKFSHYLQKGDFFGQGLFHNKGEPFTLFVDSEYVECLCINNESFKKILGGNFENVVSYNLVENALRKSEVFSKLTLKELESMILERTLICVKQNHELPLGENIYILIDGKLISKAKGNTFLSGDLVGEYSVIFGKSNKESITAVQNSLLAMISKEKIEEIINMNVSDLLKSEKEERDVDLFKHFLDSEKKKNIDVDFTKTRILKILGEGVSGLVLLVEYNEKQYALKIISKGWVIENRYEQYIRNEKIIQDLVDFTFITKLITTSKDDLSIYFFMEYVNGVDLFQILEENESLDESSTKFYVGLMLLAVEYLHRKGIIHRDLKPENILVDDTGYIKLCDLGFGKLMLSKLQRTYTIVGTPHYMAPEMIIGKGYSFPVDHYAIGVLAYVLYYGKYPFGDELEDTFQVYEAIVNQKLRFPKSKPANDDLKSMLKKILKKAPEARLGKNCESCRFQKWFEGVSWDNLLEKKVEPPFKSPVQKNKSASEFKDINLFDLIHQNEDILNLEEITKNMTSSFSGWTDIF